MSDHNDEIPFAQETVGLTRPAPSDKIVEAVDAYMKHITGGMFGVVGCDAHDACEGGPCKQEILAMNDCVEALAPFEPCKHDTTTLQCPFCGHELQEVDPPYCRVCNEYKIVPVKYCMECEEEVIG